MWWICILNLLILFATIHLTCILIQNLTQFSIVAHCKVGLPNNSVWSIEVYDQVTWIQYKWNEEFFWAFCVDLNYYLVFKSLWYIFLFWRHYLIYVLLRTKFDVIKMCLVPFICICQRGDLWWMLLELAFKDVSS